MQSQGVLSIEQMCQGSGVSRAGFYRNWERKGPDQAAMALRDAIQRASLEHPRYGAAKVAEVLRRAGVGGEPDARAAGAPTRQSAGRQTA